MSIGCGIKKVNEWQLNGKLWAVVLWLHTKLKESVVALNVLVWSENSLLKNSFSIIDKQGTGVLPNRRGKQVVKRGKKNLAVGTAM